LLLCIWPAFTARELADRSPNTLPRAQQIVSPELNIAVNVWICGSKIRQQTEVGGIYLFTYVFVIRRHLRCEAPDSPRLTQAQQRNAQQETPNAIRNDPTQRLNKTFLTELHQLPSGNGWNVQANLNYLFEIGNGTTHIFPCDIRPLQQCQYRILVESQDIGDMRHSTDQSDEPEQDQQLGRFEAIDVVDEYENAFLEKF